MLPLVVHMHVFVTLSTVAEQAAIAADSIIRDWAPPTETGKMEDETGGANIGTLVQHISSLAALYPASFVHMCVSRDVGGGVGRQIEASASALRVCERR